MANPFSPAQIDYSQLAQMGQNIGGAIGQHNFGQALAGVPKGQDGNTDYGALMDVVMERRPDLGAKMMAQSGPGGASVYGTPIYGEDGRVGVIPKAGGAIEWLDTGGVGVSQPQTWMQTPQGAIPLPTRGVPSSRGQGGQPTAVPTLESQKYRDERGEAASKVFATIAKSQMLLDNITTLKNDPNLSSALGWQQFRQSIPGGLPGSRADIGARIDQVGGAAYLEAYQDLKGGGAITDFEGKKAAQAKARLDTAQTHEDFIEALNELEYYTRLGLQRLQTGVSGGQPGVEMPPIEVQQGAATPPRGAPSPNSGSAPGGPYAGQTFGAPQPAPEAIGELEKALASVSDPQMQEAIMQEWERALELGQGAAYHFLGIQGR